MSTKNATHCKRGHEWAVYGKLGSQGYRVCGKCKAEGMKRWRSEQGDDRAVIRAQARMMRIILHECGYSWATAGQFRIDLRETTIHERSAPATGAARRDFNRCPAKRSTTISIADHAVARLNEAA
jgi:hypothetical protein